MKAPGLVARALVGGIHKEVQEDQEESRQR